MINTQIEKRDILEVIEELVPGIDLEYKNSATGPYYIAKCPLHDDHKPSFVVYPNIQRCYCYSCNPQGLDVIDFVKIYKQCNFVEACKYACLEVSEEDAIKRLLTQSMQTKEQQDLHLVAYRLKKLITQLSAEEWLALLNKVLSCSKNGQVNLLNQILIKHESK